MTGVRVPSAILISQRYSAYAACNAKRSRARMTVIADHGLPVGVTTLRWCEGCPGWFAPLFALTEP